MCGFTHGYRDLNVCYMEEQWLILIELVIRI